MMKDEKEWIKFDQLEFDDEKYNQYNIDTRDFHAGYRLIEKEKFGNISKLSDKQLKNFIVDEKTLKELLQRYYKESGGEKHWRFLIFGHHGMEWEYKYLRIFKLNTDQFVVADSYFKLIRIDILNCKAHDESPD